MQNLAKEKNLPIYIDSGKFTAAYEFSSAFYESIHKKISFYKEIIILCIGTDRATGDSLGPLIGYKLSSRIGRAGGQIHLYGTLEAPVHAKNLSETIDKIYSSHTKPFVIAVDACLGRAEYIGYMTIGEGTVKPGSGVKKELPPVGDVHITGIVNYSGLVDIAILQNTRLSLVMRMADIISEGILSAFRKMNKNSSL